MQYNSFFWDDGALALMLELVPLEVFLLILAQMLVPNDVFDIYRIAL
jgi:hypothetical protein